VLPVENDSAECARDARLFLKWIREGTLTLDQARAEILISDRQLELIRGDHGARILTDMLHRRQKTWDALIELLSGETKRKTVPVAPRSLKRRAASA